MATGRAQGVRKDRRCTHQREDGSVTAKAPGRQDLVSPLWPKLREPAEQAAGRCAAVLSRSEGTWLLQVPLAKRRSRKGGYLLDQSGADPLEVREKV